MFWTAIVKPQLRKYILSSISNAKKVYHIWNHEYIWGVYHNFKYTSLIYLLAYFLYFKNWIYEGHAFLIEQKLDLANFNNTSCSIWSVIKQNIAILIYIFDIESPTDNPLLLELGNLMEEKVNIYGDNS
jgi:hypothetical protein